MVLLEQLSIVSLFVHIFIDFHYKLIDKIKYQQMVGGLRLAKRILIILPVTASSLGLGVAVYASPVNQKISQELDE
ncbi:hypothetical protein D1B31_19835 [Neobacillus notoginsengisoli]|uniref:Uncharacterized protein n=1 Tax=Neobacillus notoginsengisoli TaxID=1578198 RepID=A0A417YLD2_9BACI|nr:hypothetical protein [Neobacillus notoginsengisoli]RHW34153.1 hypothetical protein D1B31_19835 [Neobacillus notoginsengisoli]